MITKKITGIIIPLLICCACSKENDLTPSGVSENYFEAPETATDPISLIRKEFQQKHNVYVLFNDTLRKEVVGKNTDDEPVYFIETVDLSYNFITSTQNKYEFGYLTEPDACKEAVRFVEQFILPVMDESIYPYSFLLTDRITENQYFSESQSESGYYRKSDIKVKSSYRCLALAVGDIPDFSPEERSAFIAEVFISLLSDQLMTLQQTTLASFFSVGADYYNRTDYLDDLYIEDPRELGFLGARVQWGEVRFPNPQKELDSFLEAIFSQSEDEFRTEQNEYPLVLEKYELLLKIIKDMGYHLEMI